MLPTAMAFTIKPVQYFNTTIRDQLGEAYKLLSILADRGVNMLAFTAVPVGPESTQLAVFPEDTGLLISEALNAGLSLDGPHPALLVQGDDTLGALADVHRTLYEAGVNVYASSGVAGGRGSFGYIIYVRPDDYEVAEEALHL
jgi:hypothetical protein